MSKIKSLIKYLCRQYPHTHELSNARLTKMIYLADWESARKYSKQITDIKWYFNNYGPYVDDVLNEAKKDRDIVVLQTETIYGTPKIQIKCDENVEISGINNDEKDILDQVISQTKSMYWNTFIKFVYETYPIKSNPRYSELDLVQLSIDESRQVHITSC